MNYYEGIICSLCGNEVCPSCGSCHEEHGEDDEGISPKIRKAIYCSDCQIEEIVEVSKANKCPFCGGDNVEERF